MRNANANGNCQPRLLSQGEPVGFRGSGNGLSGGIRGSWARGNHSNPCSLMVLQATGAAGKPGDTDRGDEMQPGHIYPRSPILLHNKLATGSVQRLPNSMGVETGWAGMGWDGMVVVRVWGHVNMAVVPKIIIPASPRSLWQCLWLLALHRICCCSCCSYFLLVAYF